MEENIAQGFKELQPGTTLNGGKYTIERKIGEGGFGITYKAVQNGLERTVCIKEYFPAGRCVRNTYARTIHLQGMDEEKFEKYRQAFVKEARTLATLHHPSIVEVIDVFDENNTSYMVMTFIEGRSLQTIVETSGPLSYPDAVNYLAQITDAVGYIHERHILHRDIKPENIMITADFKAILIDFGSAREFENDKTQAHTSMLTHGYAPTEQYTTNSRKGSYTDIYAIGATLYFILTGKVPMEAAARITEHMPEPREINPNIPEEANRTIMKAMQLKSQDRHQTVKEFMDDLRNIKPSQKVKPSNLEPKPEQSETPPPPPPPTPAFEEKPQQKSVVPAPQKKSKAWIFILVAVLLLGGGGAAYYFLFGVNRQAKESQGRYQNFVSQCSKLSSSSDEFAVESLLEAKAMLDSVKSLEMLYAADMPEVYNKSSELEKALMPKIDIAAAAWEQEGDDLIKLFDDYIGAAKDYKLSLSLKNDAKVEQKYKSALNTAAGK